MHWASAVYNIKRLISFLNFLFPLHLTLSLSTYLPTYLPLDTLLFKNILHQKHLKHNNDYETLSGSRMHYPFDSPNQAFCPCSIVSQPLVRPSPKKPKVAKILSNSACCELRFRASGRRRAATTVAATRKRKTDWISRSSGKNRKVWYERCIITPCCYKWTWLKFFFFFRLTDDTLIRSSSDDRYETYSRGWSEAWSGKSF